MADKIDILGSPLGMYSILRGDFIISILNDDGSLDKKKLNSLVAGIANMGANGLRDFHWIDTQDAYQKISPFWRNDDKTFTFNDRYFEHQKIIAETCNQCNMRYYLSIFDQCGTEREVGDSSPWRFFNDFFYGEDAKEMRHNFIDRILNAFDGLDTGIELCNEPKQGQGTFLADTFLYLHENNFPADKIIIGVDYHLKEKHPGTFGKDYSTLRETVADKLGNNWRQDLKSVCISPVHNAKLENIHDLFHHNLADGQTPPPGGTRRILFSMDGVRKPTRPTREQMREITRKVLNTKHEAREKGKILFEVVFGKTKNDPLDSIEGVSDVYKEFWGVFPQNHGQFPDSQVIIDDTTPQTGEIVVIEEESVFETLVVHGFRGILGREADPTGLKAYTKFLDEGGEVIDFCRKLIQSDEFQRDRSDLKPRQMGKALYQGILDRRPDPEGLKHTIEFIKEGKLAERAAAMLISPEFKTKFG